MIKVQVSQPEKGPFIRPKIVLPVFAGQEQYCGIYNMRQATGL